MACRATIYDPATGNPDGTERQTFAGNRIPANRINPVSSRIQALAPLPESGRHVARHPQQLLQLRDRES